MDTEKLLETWVIFYLDRKPTADTVTFEYNVSGKLFIILSQRVTIKQLLNTYISHQLIYLLLSGHRLLWLLHLSTKHHFNSELKNKNYYNNLLCFKKFNMKSMISSDYFLYFTLLSFLSFFLVFFSSSNFVFWKAELSAEYLLHARGLEGSAKSFAISTYKTARSLSAHFWLPIVKHSSFTRDCIDSQIHVSRLCLAAAVIFQIFQTFITQEEYKYTYAVSIWPEWFWKYSSYKKA